LPSHVRAHHERPRAVDHPALDGVIDDQAPSPSSSSNSLARSTGVAGWMVDTACL
jgi:hypothetical protein